MKKYCRPYRIYKPRKDKGGAASAFQIVSYLNHKDKERLVVFLEMANQIKTDDDSDKFHWNNKEMAVTVQLDDPDISELILVLIGAKEGAGYLKDGKWSGLYHNNPKGNTVINLSSAKNGGFILGVSSRRDNQTVRVSHLISQAEAVILLEVFRAYFARKYATVIYKKDV